MLAGPALNRLEGWYFLEQMRKFRSGERGYHLLDETGRIMAAASKGISNDSLKDVVAYVVHTWGPEDEPSMWDRMVPAKSENPSKHHIFVEGHRACLVCPHHPILLCAQPLERVFQKLLF